MREVLFRAKRLDNGERVEGFLICPLFDKSRAYIGTLFAVDDHDTDVAEVDPETVGQYTGLCDKNGVRIFEGDIIKYTTKERSSVYIVGWNAEAACFVFCGLGFYSLGLGEKFPIDDFTFFNPQKCEVLGNIYDNHGLLEGGD